MIRALRLVMADPVVVRDIIGQELALCDLVAVVKSNCLVVAKIIKFSPKMVILEVVGSNRIRSSRVQAYPDQVSKLDQPSALMHVLKAIK